MDQGLVDELPSYICSVRLKEGPRALGNLVLVLRSAVLSRILQVAMREEMPDVCFPDGKRWARNARSY